jgi:hypothetical protein
MLTYKELMSPDVQAPYYNEITASIKHELVKDMSTGAAYVYKSARQPTGGVTAESYGARSGYMNVVTKSGGNEFHGAAQFYYTDQNLQKVLIPTETLTALGLPQPTFAYYTYDTSATLGGPILKDKIWFFTSSKFYSQKSHVNYIPTTIEDVYYGPYDRVETIPFFFGKLTFQINKDIKLFSTYNYTNAKIPHFYTGWNWGEEVKMEGLRWRR